MKVLLPGDSGLRPVFRAPPAPALPEGWGPVRQVDSPEVPIKPEDGCTRRPAA